MSKICDVCGKPLKFRDFSSENYDNGYCRDCLDKMGVHALVEQMCINKEDLLDAFGFYLIWEKESKNKGGHGNV